MGAFITLYPICLLYTSGYDDAAAQGDGGEILPVGHLVGVGQSDAQHISHILHGQHQGQFVERAVLGSFHRIPFYPSRGRDFILCFAPHFLRHLHGHAAHGLLLYMVIRPVAQSDSLFLERLKPLVVNVHPGACGILRRIVPEDVAHVVEELCD